MAVTPLAFETQYGASMITNTNKHQQLANGLKVGMRLHSEKVIRLGDAKPMHLGHTLVADGRWRLIVFANAVDTGQIDEPSGQSL